MTATEANATPEKDDGIDALRADTARYGAAYAIMRDGFTGKGVDRAVVVMKVFIAATAAYALVAAVWVGVGG